MFSVWEKTTDAVLRNSAEIQVTVANTDVKTFKAGESIFNEGDVSRDVYIVKHGMVKILKRPANSPPVELAILKPGAFFGEMSFFDGEPRSAAAVALTDAEVHIIPPAALEAQFNTQPAWMVSFVKNLVSRLRSANQRIKELEINAPRIQY